MVVLEELVQAVEQQMQLHISGLRYQGQLKGKLEEILHGKKKFLSFFGVLSGWGVFL